MTINELLQQVFNATDEQLSAFSEAMKNNKIFTASEENLDIRYGKLKTDHEGTVKELETTKSTLESLRKAAEGQEELQKKLADHDRIVGDLQKQLADEKWRNRARLGLMQAGADDIDYVLYKLEESMTKEGKERKLTNADDIDGWEDLLKNVQTQLPQRFPKSEKDEEEYQVFNPNQLKKGDDGNAAITKEKFMAMSYEERMALKAKNEKLYTSLVK